MRADEEKIYASSEEDCDQKSLKPAALAIFRATVAGFLIDQ
jgi:hypothetical protein